MDMDLEKLLETSLCSATKAGCDTPEMYSFHMSHEVGFLVHPAVIEACTESMLTVAQAFEIRRDHGTDVLKRAKELSREGFYGQALIKRAVLDITLARS